MAGLLRVGIDCDRRRTVGRFAAIWVEEVSATSMACLAAAGCDRALDLADAALVLQADLGLLPGHDLGRRPGAPVVVRSRRLGLLS